MIRAEKAKDLKGPLKSHSVLEQRVGAWPKWESYFESLNNLTFVHIGAKNTAGKVDDISAYATKNHWQGYAIQPDADRFKELQSTYAKMGSVTPLQVLVSDKDSATDLATGNATAAGAAVAQKAQIPSYTLPSLWGKHVVGKLAKVDILAIDVQGAELKLLKAQIVDPKPRFILFKYNRLGRPDYRKIGTSLEENGYKYVGRDGEDELHELIVRK